jgi:hypothetical protein
MAVERHVVAIIAGVAAVLRWRRLLAVLAGGPTAGPLPRVAEAWRRRPVPVVVAGVLQLDERRSSGGCGGYGGGGAAPRGCQVQQPPLLLRLLPLPVLPRTGERRIHPQGVVGGDDVLKGPRDRLADCRVLGPRSLRGSEVRRSCGRYILLLRLPLAAAR